MVMPAQGPNTIVYICKEATPGTTPASPEWMQVGIKPGGGFTPQTNEIQSTILAGDPNPRLSIFGNKAPSGNLSFEPGFGLMGFLMEACLGTRVTTGASSPYTHTSKIVLGAMPTYTVVEVLDTGDGYAIVARGASCNTSKFTIGSEGPLTLDTSWMAQAVTSELASVFTFTGAHDFTTEQPIDQANLATGYVKVNGSAVAYVRTGTIDVNQNLKGDDYRAAGGGNRASVPRGRATVSVALEAVWDTNSATAVRTAVATPSTNYALDFSWLVSSTATFTVSLGTTRLKGTLPTIPDGEMTATLTFTAAKDGTAGTAITAASINTLADTVYYVA